MYQSPFSPNEIKYFMSLMMNDATEGQRSNVCQVRGIIIKYKTRSEVYEIST